MRQLKLLPVVLVLCGATHALAVPPIELEQAVVRHFEAGRYETAAEIIKAYLAEHPDEDVMHYNLACAYSRMGEIELAAQSLLKAVETGFRDFTTMKRDPDLEAIRNHRIFTAIVEAERRVSNEGAEVQLEQWRETYGERHYRYEVDEAHRLTFACALDDTSYQEMRAMLSAQADQMVRSLFGEPPSFFVLIAVPTMEDSRRILGEGRTAGVYQHHRRRIVSQDIGTSLRHEFFHAYHYGHMERLRQTHPIAIQEGLAALYENYEISAAASITFLPNERHRIVQNQMRAHILRKWSDLFTLESDVFMKRASALYPQMRSIFEFVADQGKLADWYRTYTETFEEDRYGLAAFETVFEKPLKEIEADWHAWLEARPTLRHAVDWADVGFVPASEASNDGVVVTRVLPRSPASQARLHPGDVIVAADGHSTRTLGELDTVLASKAPGEVFELRVRSGRRYRTIQLQIPR